MLTAQSYPAHTHGALTDHVTLTYEDRFMRRKVLMLASGAQLLVDLPTDRGAAKGAAVFSILAPGSAVFLA